jgi:hypothetical protein
MASMFGSEGQEVPGALYPYFDQQPTPDELFEELQRIENGLEPDGKGGYKWRQQP